VTVVLKREFLSHEDLIAVGSSEDAAKQETHRIGADRPSRTPSEFHDLPALLQELSYLKLKFIFCFVRAQW
jgi:hypothetical protein